MADYKGFYEAIIDKAEGFGRIYEAHEVLGMSEREAALVEAVVQDIVSSAEQFVPGGYHTEIFNVTIKEEA